MADDWRTLNRAMWDSKAPLHLASALYDVESFKRGRSELRAIELADLGDVRGKSLLHLQCHIGLDTLSWAREGARVTGLDFSAASIEAARDLAQEIGAEARFVTGDVYDAPQLLSGERFDIVYTGIGALCWLPDMNAWAQAIAQLLKPGGELYLFEFHPFEWMLLGPSARALTIQDDYFTPPEGWHDDVGVTYAAASPEKSPTVQWNHPLGEVVSAVAAAGLKIESLRELDHSVLQRWPEMERTPDGMFRFPAGVPRLPLMYVLRARLLA